MTHQLAISQARCRDLEQSVAESEERRKKNASSSATVSGRGLRDSEDNFLRSERYKEEAELLKRQKVELEASLLDRDSQLLEMRFDFEAAQSEASRLARRVQELQQAYRSLQNMTGTAGLGISGIRQPTVATGSTLTSSRREAELEGVVEALKRVVDKLKAENERLKRSNTTTAASGSAGGGSGGAGSAGGLAGGSAEVERQRKRAEKAEEEVRALNEKLKTVDTSSQQVVAKQAQVAQLRKNLKTSEEEVARLKREAVQQQQTEDSLRRRLQQVEDRLQALQVAQGMNEAKADMSEKYKEASRELESLRRQMSTQEEEMVRLRQQLRQRPAPESTTSTTAQQQQLEADVRTLREENAKLRSELSAFDLDFFEEIENLKYAHAEAVRKLRAYEARGGR